jgi:hypothetical protein
MTHHRDEPSIAAELRALGRGLPGPDIDATVDSVLARIADEPAPAPTRRVRVRRWARAHWRALILALCGALIAVAVTPAARAAIADWFAFGGVEVHVTPSAPTPTAQPVAGCGSLTLPEATEGAGFRPYVPKALGAPDAAAVSSDHRVLSLCWHRAGGRVVRIDEFRAAIDPLMGKQVRTPPDWETIHGRPALWFAEAHRLTLRLVGPGGDPYSHEVRTAGPTLVWQHGGRLTLRLEGVAGKARALRIAAS